MVDQHYHSALSIRVDTQLQLLYSQLKAMQLSNAQFIDEGKNIIECSKQAYNLYKQQTAEEKRRLLNVMFDSITVVNRTIKYTYKKPFCYFAKCNLTDVDKIVDFIKNNISK